MSFNSWLVLARTLARTSFYAEPYGRYCRGLKSYQDYGAGVPICLRSRMWFSGALKSRVPFYNAVPFLQWCLSGFTTIPK